MSLPETIRRNPQLGLRPGNRCALRFEARASIAGLPSPIRMADEDGAEFDALRFDGFCAGMPVVVIAEASLVANEIRRVLLDSIHVTFNAREIGLGPQGESWLMACDDGSPKKGVAPEPGTERWDAARRSLGPRERIPCP